MSEGPRQLGGFVGGLVRGCFGVFSSISFGELVSVFSASWGKL